MNYTIGSLVHMLGTFQVSGTNTDPTGVTFSLYRNGTLVVTYVYGTDVELVKSATGIYYVNYNVTLAGNYQWVMAGTGTVVARQWDSFTVNPDPAAPT